VVCRPYHHGNLRAALLAEAERTLREQGADGLSLRELARQIGVSHAAPRRHFPDRQALLDALAECGFERLGCEVREALEKAGDVFEARLGALAAAYIRFATEDAALLEVMFAAKQGEQSANLRQACEGLFAVTDGLIRQGQQAGRLQSGDPQRVARIILAAMQGIAVLVNSGSVEAEQVDGLISDMVRLFTGPTTSEPAVAFGAANPS
jgi:AcrR family transcriptional regulator